MIAVSAEIRPPSPGPRAGVTVTGLGIGESVITVWRLADDTREPLPGYEGHPANDATFITDYYVPLNRPVQYEVEVLSGPSGPARATSSYLTVESATGWLMDPLVPQNAVPVVGERRSDGDIYLRGPALKNLEYAADVSMIQIMGQKKPMGLFADRMAEQGLDTSMATRSAQENTRLKKLLRSTASLHFRPLPEWGEIDLEGSLFLLNPVVRQTPVNVLMGGKLTWWDMVSDVVSAPTIKVLTATYTYGDVKMFLSTYQQKQDLMVGKTYLDDLKNPLGGS